MGAPVVHFEILGKDPERLKTYYADLFGWEIETPLTPRGTTASFSDTPTRTVVGLEVASVLGRTGTKVM